MGYSELLEQLRKKVVDNVYTEEERLLNCVDNSFKKVYNRLRSAIEQNNKEMFVKQLEKCIGLLTTSKQLAVLEPKQKPEIPISTTSYKMVASSTFNQKINQDININPSFTCLNILIKLAVTLDRTEIVKLLLNTGVPINVQDEYGNTMLIHAAIKGYTETVNILLERGADPMILNKSGNSVLLYAVRHNRYHIVKLLINCIYSYEDKLLIVNRKNCYGVTPVSEAKNKRYNHIFDLLNKKLEKIEI